MAQAVTREFSPSDKARVHVEIAEEFPHLHFNTEGYSGFLSDLGFSDGHIESTTVAFSPFSNMLQQQTATGREAGPVHLGSYNGGIDDRHVLKVNVGDVLLYAHDQGSPVVKELNDTLSHETGHMYRRVIQGIGDSAYRRLLIQMQDLGAWLGHVPLAAFHKTAIQELLPLYVDKPVLVGSVAVGSLLAGVSISGSSQALEKRRYRKCPDEAFADAFGTEFQVPEFISVIDSKSK